MTVPVIPIADECTWYLGFLSAAAEVAERHIREETWAHLGLGSFREGLRAAAWPLHEDVAIVLGGRNPLLEVFYRKEMTQ